LGLAREHVGFGVVEFEFESAHDVVFLDEEEEDEGAGDGGGGVCVGLLFEQVPDVAGGVGVDLDA
jgi:hypothetical protein